MNHLTLWLILVLLLAIFPLAWLINTRVYQIEPSIRATPGRFCKMGSTLVVLGGLGGFVLLPYFLWVGDFLIPIATKYPYPHVGALHVPRDEAPGYFWFFVSVLYVAVLLAVGNGVMLLAKLWRFRKDRAAERWANLTGEKWVYHTPVLKGHAMAWSSRSNTCVLHVSYLGLNNGGASEENVLPALYEALRKARRQFEGYQIRLEAGSPAMRSQVLKLAATGRIAVQPVLSSHPNDFIVTAVNDA